MVCNVANCFSCIDHNICGKCSGDFLLMNGQCLNCQVDNCLSCFSNNQCGLCQDNYYLIPSSIGISSRCVICLEPCSTCNS